MLKNEVYMQKCRTASLIMNSYNFSQIKMKQLKQYEKASNLNRAYNYISNTKSIGRII